MIMRAILEGLGLGVLLVLVCAFGIRRGAVGMVHLYSPAVQSRCVALGLTTHERIKRNSVLFKACCIPGYIAYVLVCVYAINGARGFLTGFWQLLVILSVMNLIDRLLVDGWWVGRTKASAGLTSSASHSEKKISSEKLFATLGASITLMRERLTPDASASFS